MSPDPEETFTIVPERRSRHGRDHRLHRPQRPEEVRLEHLVRARFVEGFENTDVAEPRVVHEDIDLAGVGGDVGDRVGDRRRVVDVRAR